MFKYVVNLGDADAEYVQQNASLAASVRDITETITAATVDEKAKAIIARTK